MRRGRMHILYLIKGLSLPETLQRSCSPKASLLGEKSELVRSPCEADPRVSRRLVGAGGERAVTLREAQGRCNSVKYSSFDRNTL